MFTFNPYWTYRNVWSEIMRCWDVQAWSVDRRCWVHIAYSH